MSTETTSLLDFLKKTSSFRFNDLTAISKASVPLAFPIQCFVVIYLAKLLTSKSLPEIGRYFSNRDHTTVIHSVKTIERLRKEDNELNISIDNLKNKILYNKENEV